MNDGQNQQFRGLIRVVRLQAIQQRLLMGKVGFEQHLNFILLLEFPFPVIERGGARQQRGTGGQLVRQRFCRQILGGRFIRRGTEHNNSIRRSHHEPRISEKRHYSTQDAGILASRSGVGEGNGQRARAGPAASGIYSIIPPKIKPRITHSVIAITPGIRKAWLKTYLPMRVEPVSSISTAASRVG